MMRIAYCVLRIAYCVLRDEPDVANPRMIRDG